MQPEVVEVRAWERRRVDISTELATALTESGLVEAVPCPGGWELRAGSKVGVLQGTTWELRVMPALDVPNLLFLLAYARDPRGWKDEVARFGPAADLVESIAHAYAWHATTALERGVLRGYVTRDERALAVRGRIRFADQMARGAGLPLPIEIQYDEFSEDIVENRILKSAAAALLRFAGLGPVVRRRLAHVCDTLAEAGPVERPRDVEMPTISRLNGRYEQALRLAVFILRGAAPTVARGRVAATGFAFDMNRVFEEFVTTAVTAALAARGERIRAQYPAKLDEEGLIDIKPDLVWVGSDGTVRGVLDAKYKALSVDSVPNADTYQMLAYCSALGLEHGFLVYATDAGDVPRDHHVRGSDVAVAVRTLDVTSEPSPLLQSVGLLVDEVAHGAAA